jgi:hypothetical protein
MNAPPATYLPDVRIKSGGTAAPADVESLDEVLTPEVEWNGIARDDMPNSDTGSAGASTTTTVNVGPVTVDWDYGGGDYRVLQGTSGVRGVKVIAYVASEWAANPGTAVPRGSAVSDDQGKWYGMGLSSGVSYTLVAYPNDGTSIKTMSLTVS